MVPLIRKYAQEDPAKVNLEWSHTFLIESSGRRENSEGLSTRGNGGSTTPSTTPRASHKKHRKPRPHPEGESGIDNNETSQNNAALCELHPHPCVPGQKKFCRKEKNRIRFRKCRPSTDILFEESPRSKVIEPECTCPRVKRRATPDFDWDSERKLIDEEIEVLKLRIEELREQRREMRRQWMDGIALSKAKYPVPQEPRGQGQGRRSGSKFRQTTTTPQPTPALLLTISTLEPEDEFDQLFRATIANETLDLGVSEEEDLDLDLAEEEDEDDEVLRIYDEPGMGRKGHKQNGKGGRRHHGGGRELLFQGQEVKNRTECTCDPHHLRQREKEERREKKLRSKLRKKQRFLKRIDNPGERQEVREGSGPSEHWMTFDSMTFDPLGRDVWERGQGELFLA
jgi:hypothetical protein